MWVWLLHSWTYVVVTENHITHIQLIHSGILTLIFSGIGWLQPEVYLYVHMTPIAVVNLDGHIWHKFWWTYLTQSSSISIDNNFLKVLGYGYHNIKSFQTLEVLERSFYCLLRLEVIPSMIPSYKKFLT